MEDFSKLISGYKYLVLGNDNTCNVFKSLRDISNDISVDYTTISKKLKENNNEYCYCVSKETKGIFFVKKFKIDMK